MENLNIFTDNGWIRLNNNNAIEIKDKSLETQYTTKGKYMFFSDDKQDLINLAKVILPKYNLYQAKTPESNVPNKTNGFGFVLCVYDFKNRYASELKEFETSSITYRYWKSDNSTRKGKYSKRYKRNY